MRETRARTDNTFCIILFFYFIQYLPDCCVFNQVCITVEIDNEKVHLEDGDVLYLSKGTNYSAIGNFEAVVINSPAFGVIKE